VHACHQGYSFSICKKVQKLWDLGWAFWRWSYIEDQNIPAFNLTKVINDRIQPGPDFKYFLDAYL